MTVTHSITMDLVKPLVRPLVTAVQGEGCSRVLQITLLAQGAPFSVPGDATAVVRYRKRDGTGGIYDTLPDGTRAWSASANVLFVTLAPQVLTCDGEVDLQVELRQGSGVLSTFSVCLLVDADPSQGAQPSGNYFNWMDATVDALAAYLKEYPIPGGSAMCPTDQHQLQQFLAQGVPVLIAKSFPLTGPIVIDRSHVYLEFAHNVTLDLRGKDFPAILVTYKEDGNKPSFITVKNASILGDGTKGSVGIRLEAMSYNCHIDHLNVDGCEYGIQTTGGFDCVQQNTFYEPYICNCRYGIDDRSGGMQNCRFYGGRIENNDEYGLVTASPNLCFTGTMIQGNTLGEVKLLNTVGVGAVRKSGGTFDNCYFEHLPRYETDGDGNQIPIKDAVFRLGDETQGEGWFGSLNLVGCKIAGYHNYVVGSKGRGPIFEGIAESNQQFIQMIGCSCSSDQLFYLPNMDNGCRMMLIGHTKGMKYFPTTDVGPLVSVQFLNNAYSKLGAVLASSISGKEGPAAPVEYARTRKLCLEAAGTGYGQYREFTLSDNLPWEEETAGSLTGSLHYCAKYHGTDADGNKIYFKTPGWFVRTASKGGADAASKWGAWVPGNAWGVQEEVHGKDLRIEASGSEYGNWIAITYANALPWEYSGAGSITGSLHYSSKSPVGWYQRVTSKGSADSAAKWEKLVRAASDGTMNSTLTRELRVVSPDNTAVSVTFSDTLPWLDASVGAREGSLHCRNGVWYLRVTALSGEDTAANWNKIVTEAAQ